MHYALIDKTGFSVADLRKMALAINHMGSDFHHAQNSGAVQVSAATPLSVPDDATVVASFEHDDPNAPGALAYHDEYDGRPYIRVLVDAIKQAGGGVLEPQSGYSILGALSHEVWENEGDPFANRWVSMVNGKLVALELADPVEATFIADPKTGLQVSNYVLPSYFDAQSKATKFDAAGVIRAPFEIAGGGYQIINAGGKITEVFGEKMPEWRRKMHKRRLHIRKARLELHTVTAHQ